MGLYKNQMRRFLGVWAAASVAYLVTGCDLVENIAPRDRVSIAGLSEIGPEWKKLELKEPLKAYAQQHTIDLRIPESSGLKFSGKQVSEPNGAVSLFLEDGRKTNLQARLLDDQGTAYEMEGTASDFGIQFYKKYTPEQWKNRKLGTPDLPHNRKYISISFRSDVRLPIASASFYGQNSK